MRSIRELWTDLIYRYQIDFVSVSVLLLLIIIIGNLNGVLYYYFEIVAPLSPIILVVSVGVSLWFLLKMPMSESIGWHLFVGFMIVYLLIAGIMGFIHYNQLYAPHWMYTLVKGYVGSLAIIFLFYRLTYYSLENGLLRQLMNYLLFFLMIGTVFILISFFNNLNIFSLDESRAGGLYANPNSAAKHLLYTLVVLLSLSLSKGRSFSLSYLLLVPVVILAIFTTFSKSAFILAPVLLIWYFLYAFKNRASLSSHSKKAMRGLFLIMLLLGVIFSKSIAQYASTLNTGQLKRIQKTVDILTGQITESTTSERLTLYKRGVAKISDAPLLGHGLSSFHIFDFSMNGRHIGVHNTFLMLIGEAGIVPLLLFLGFLGWFAWCAITVPDLSLRFFLLSSLFIFVVYVCGTSHTALDERISNIILGICIGIIHYLSTNKDHSQISSAL